MLPTASNLARWKRITDPSCPLCNTGKPQTNKHVLSNCSASVALDRFTSRHDDVLRLLIDWLKSVISANQQLWVDLSDAGLQSTGDLFSNYRPDIAIVDNNSVRTWELTICHETNLLKSKLYKVNKYSDLAKSSSTLIADKSIYSFTIEVSTLGFISNVSDFLAANALPQLPLDLKRSIIRSVTNSSFKIYLNRNSSTVY